MNRKKRVWKIILFLSIILLLFIARPLGFLIYNYYKDKKPVKLERTGYTNDASNLNETKVDSIVKVSTDINEAIGQISQLVVQAKIQGKKISIAGARHSMGGHTIYPNGIILDMTTFNYMKLDSPTNILQVGSGAKWSEVIPYLDVRNRSITVMQSNNSFTVGGSISVNCHGWQANSPPIAATVQSFRLINADGVLLNCSRDDNAELFSLVLGGYGLFGVILDVKLKVVDNKMYNVRQRVIKSVDYIKEFDERVNGVAGIGMTYGRININPNHFMEEAILSIFTVDNFAELKPIQKAKYVAIRRTVFRSSANSTYGKNLRWKAEKMIVSQMNGKKFSRNQLLNEGVEIFQNTDTSYTDILQEYFIPKDSVVQFIKSLKVILPVHKVDLLNITIRNVKKDDDTFLRYATEEVFGFVMLFNQARTEKAEAEMKSLTQTLINTAISCKGTYYLPYRLHATREQMYRAYPQAQAFFSLKRKYDPSEVFRNQFYETYK